MDRHTRQLLADWLSPIGAAVLLASLSLTWSHQFPPSLLAVPEMRTALAGVPPDASAWDVYSAVDVLLALLAVSVIVCAVWGLGRGRLVVIALVALAIGFTIHAVSVPPTNGADVIVPGQTRYVSADAQSGPGETAALVGLAMALVGLVLSPATPAGTGLREPPEAPAGVA